MFADLLGLESPCHDTQTALRGPNHEERVPLPQQQQQQHQEHSFMTPSCILDFFLDVHY